MTYPEIELYRRLFANAHGWLEGTVADLTPDQAAWQPPGSALPAGAHDAHHLIAEDVVCTYAARGEPPLIMSSWRGRSGISELPTVAEGNETIGARGRIA